MPEADWRSHFARSVAGICSEVAQAAAAGDVTPAVDDGTEVRRLLSQMQQVVQSAFRRVNAALLSCLNDICSPMTDHQAITDEAVCGRVAIRLKSFACDEVAQAARGTSFDLHQLAGQAQRAVEEAVRTRVARAAALGGGGQGPAAATAGSPRSRPGPMGLVTQILSQGFSKSRSQEVQATVDTREKEAQSEVSIPPDSAAVLQAEPDSASEHEVTSEPEPRPVKQAEPQGPPDVFHRLAPVAKLLKKQKEDGLIDYRRRGEPQLRGQCVELHFAVLRALRAFFTRMGLPAVEIGDTLVREQKLVEAQSNTIRGERATDYVQLHRVLAQDTRVCEMTASWLSLETPIARHQAELASRSVRLRVHQQKLERNAQHLFVGLTRSATRHVRVNLRRIGVHIDRCCAVRQELTARRQQMYAGFCFRMKQLADGAPEPDFAAKRPQTGSPHRGSLAGAEAARRRSCAPASPQSALAQGLSDSFEDDFANSSAEFSGPGHRRRERLPDEQAQALRDAPPGSVTSRTTTVRTTTDTVEVTPPPLSPACSRKGGRLSPSARTAGGARTAGDRRGRWRWAGRCVKSAGAVAAVGGGAVHSARSHSTSRFPAWLSRAPSLHA